MKKIQSIADLTPDRKNANRGTERGRGALENSLGKFGAARSIVADKNGVIMAGNQTLQVAAEMGMEGVIVVPTDGTKLVVVQRTDWDSEKDKAPREYAYHDNRVGELNLEFDPLRVADDLAQGVDIADLWSEKELAILLKGIEAPNLDEEGGEGGRAGKKDDLKYELQFDSDAQRTQWYGLLSYLNKAYTEESVGARLARFITDLEAKGVIE